MSILVLNGSPRPKGNTRQITDAFRSGAESAGHRVDELTYAGKRLRAVWPANTAIQRETGPACRKMICRKSIPFFGRRICLLLLHQFIITVFQGS